MHILFPTDVIGVNEKFLKLFCLENTRYIVMSVIIDFLVWV